MSEERVTAAVLAPEDEDFDGSLRPRSLDEFVGQERIKEQLAGLNASQPLTVYGRVAAGQADLGAGNYTESITVTVTY